MKRFKKIYVEITNVCNLKCSFCSEMKRAPAFMKEETFRSILDQITPFTDYIYLHVKGEPLLHPQIDRFLDLAYEKGLKVNLTTNGTLIEKQALMLMSKPALRQINFSLHSFGESGQILSEDEYFSRIFSFIQSSLKNSETIMSLRLWNHDQSDSSTLASNKNCEVLTRIERAFQLPYKIDEKINTAQGVKIADKVYLSLESEFEWPSLEQKEDFGSGFCYALKSQAAILVDGTVVPCCLDADGVIKLGNVLSTPFAEIIEGERAEKIFSGFKRREVVESLCRGCTYRKRFNRI